ncbi:glycogen debranching protein [Candidatus Omnitrophota bacterium]
MGEFKTLVREMHKAGLEVIIDVVYNHTGEGNELGPTLCFKGIDNPTYYSLMGPPEEPYRSYRNDTGCGNTLNIEHPQVLRLVLDSLRYWADVMHVDGFRFDMASILARVKGEFNKRSLFFEAISKDPVLSKVKLIAEPWDISAYEIGNFPLHWSEWNAKFRDTVRRFVKGDQGQIQDLARRLTGSADLYGDDERSPYNSINCVTCHDGFSLRDLFSYNNKHNEANGEENRDGINENHSWNCGVEGDTNDPAIIDLRKQLVKNSLCCLLFSLGTPMVLSGDECMKTQKGNNNAYCQDNEVTWMNWDLVKQYTDMYEFAQKAISFRKRYTILQRKKFLSGKDTDADTVPDILWYGENLSAPRWDSAEEKLLCYQLDGSEVPSKLGDYHLFFMLNSDIRARTVELPRHDTKRWNRVVDTSLKNGDDFLEQGEEKTIDPPDRYVVNSRSVVVLLGK